MEESKDQLILENTAHLQFQQEAWKSRYCRLLEVPVLLLTKK